MARSLDFIASRQASHQDDSRMFDVRPPLSELGDSHLYPEKSPPQFPQNKTTNGVRVFDNPAQ